LAPRLRWLAAVLGEVRDLDVHLDGLPDYRSHVEAYEQSILDRYQDHLLTLRTEAHRDLVGALDDAAFVALIKDFRALLAAVAADEGSSVTLEEVTGEIVRDDLPRFREHGRSVDTQSSDKALHRLRIDGKRLRYQLEFLSGAYGAPLANAIRTLKRLQSHLGGVQDAHVARMRLGDYRRGYASGTWAPRTFKRLVRLEKRRGRQLRRRVADDWAAFESAAEDLVKAL
jgi:CHAD domain-containing protein